MPDESLTRKSATELAALIRARRVSPRELLDAHLEVIERVNLLRSPDAGGFVRSALLDRLLLTLCHFIVVPSMAMEAQLLARGVP